MNNIGSVAAFTRVEVDIVNPRGGVAKKVEIRFLIAGCWLGSIYYDARVKWWRLASLWWKLVTVVEVILVIVLLGVGEVRLPKTEFRPGIDGLRIKVIG